jgi:hypothetical protein
MEILILAPNLKKMCVFKDYRLARKNQRSSYKSDLKKRIKPQIKESILKPFCFKV